MNEYCTLNEVRDYLTSSNLEMGLGDDDRILKYINDASRMLEKYCGGRKFYPKIATRYYNYQNTWQLLLDEDLLEASTVTAAGVEVLTADYLLYPLNDYPKSQIQILRTGTAMFTYDASEQKAIDVEATWGWHDDWDNAWLDSLDSVQNDPTISASDTALSVNDVEDANADGFSPRFARGQLLKIEDEWLAVVGVNYTTEELTVKRGVNGSTAAVHAKNEPIYTYEVPNVVNAACLALTKMIYEMRMSTAGIVAVPGMMGTVMKTSVQELLENFDLPVRPDSHMGFI